MSLFKYSEEVSTIEEPLRSAVLATEVTGRRTAMTREGAPVAILISWDEFLSMHETLALEGDSAALSAIRAGDAALTGGTFHPEPLAENVAAAPGVLADGLEEEIAAIAANPICGAPLLGSLRGLWVLRNGPTRVIYRIAGDGRNAAIVYAGPAGERS